MKISGTIGLFVNEKQTQDKKAKYISYETYLQAKNEKGEVVERVYIPVLLKKNVDKSLFTPGKCYNLDLDDTADNNLTLTYYNGKTKQIIYLEKFNIKSSYDIKRKQA